MAAQRRVASDQTLCPHHCRHLHLDCLRPAVLAMQSRGLPKPSAARRSGGVGRQGTAAGQPQAMPPRAAGERRWSERGLRWPQLLDGVAVDAVDVGAFLHCQ